MIGPVVDVEVVVEDVVIGLPLEVPEVTPEPEVELDVESREEVPASVAEEGVPDVDVDVAKAEIVCSTTEQSSPPYPPLQVQTPVLHVP